MKIIVIIPVRMASSRFPGKPLAKLLGMTMLEHVYRRCKLCKKVDEVYVATPDHNIAKEVKNFGGKPIMTSPLHKRACVGVISILFQTIIWYFIVLLFYRDYITKDKIVGIIKELYKLASTGIKRKISVLI